MIAARQVTFFESDRVRPAYQCRPQVPEIATGDFLPRFDSPVRRRSIALRGTDATTRSNETIMTAVTQTRGDVAVLKKVPMLIGGKWVESASGQVLEVEDPAHRRPIAEIPRGRVEDVARRHFPLGRA